MRILKSPKWLFIFSGMASVVMFFTGEMTFVDINWRSNVYYVLSKFHLALFALLTSLIFYVIYSVQQKMEWHKYLMWSHGSVNLIGIIVLLFGVGMQTRSGEELNYQLYKLGNLLLLIGILSIFLGISIFVINGLILLGRRR